MSKLNKFVALLTFAAMPFTAHAQDTAGQATATELPAQNPIYIRETEGDWSLECRRVETGEEPCQLFQDVVGAEQNNLANVRIFKLEGNPPAIAGALIAVPLNTLLTANLRITIDDQPGKVYPYKTCDVQGCYARIGLTQEDIDAYKAGSVAKIEIVPFAAPNVVVAGEMSLKGFTAAYGKAVIDTGNQ